MAAESCCCVEGVACEDDAASTAIKAQIEKEIGGSPVRAFEIGIGFEEEFSSRFVQQSFDMSRQSRIETCS